MRQKESRWYVIEGDTAYVYDQPYTSKAVGMSIIPAADLTYYRQAFRLTKAWGYAPQD